MTDDRQPAETLRDLLEGHRRARDLVFERADLRGVQLSGLQADGLELVDADLRDADLSRVRWHACALRDARLDHANLRDASLRMCNFDRARAIGAALERARFENSSAQAAVFDEADFRAATLTESDLSRASLRGANLEGISGEGLILRGADLRKANLRDAILIGADLRGADLRDADLEGADLEGAELDGALGRASDPTPIETPSMALPPEFMPLAGLMTPIVQELLTSAGERGHIDAQVAARLLEDVARLSPARGPNLDPRTIDAVANTVATIGDDVLPALLDGLARPDDDGDPPEAIIDLLVRLSRELELADGASAEQLLEALTGRASPTTDEQDA